MARTIHERWSARIPPLVEPDPLPLEFVGWIEFENAIENPDSAVRIVSEEHRIGVDDDTGVNDGVTDGTAEVLLVVGHEDSAGCFAVLE